MKTKFNDDNAPTPCLNNKKDEIDNNRNIKNKKEIVIQFSNDSVFSILFTKKTYNIEIECNDILSEEQDKYFNSLNKRDWNKLSLFKSYNNIDDIFGEIEKLDEKNISLKQQNDNMLLKITLLNQFSSEILLYNSEDYKNNINNSIPEFEELKINKIINENIKTENNNLEERIEKLEYLYKNIYEKIIKSLPYNSFDDSLYELDRVYHKLPKNCLIKNKKYLGLINNELKKIYKKNIFECELNFQLSHKINNPDKDFQEIIKSLKNILIIIKTLNGNIFGFFYSNSPNQNKNIQNNNPNQNGSYINNPMNNQLYNPMNALIKNNLMNDELNIGNYQIGQNYNRIMTNLINFENDQNVQNNNQINNQTTEIFNTNLYTDNNIIFSYTNNKTFIKEDCIYPNFSIHYDINKKCFQGNDNSINGKYLLNGTQTFIISAIEVYEILYD